VPTVEAPPSLHETWKAGVMAALPWPDEVSPDTRALVAEALDALSVVGIALSIWSVPNARREVVARAWSAVVANMLTLITLDVGLRGEEARACARQLASELAHVNITFGLEQDEIKTLSAILDALPLE
jgi:hypothetical protein